MKECYECSRLVHELSPRSRCVRCEYKRAVYNENDTLVPIVDHKNKSELARQLGTTRQQIQQWAKSAKPVYVYHGHVFRKLS